MPDTMIEVNPDEQAVVAAVVEGTPAVPQVPDEPQGPDRNAIALKILEDTELPPEDFEKARTDPEFMSALVDAYIEEEQKTPSGAAPKGTQAKTAGESETPKEGQEEGKRKPRRGFQRKIDRLTERTLSLEAELEAERRQRTELEARMAGRHAVPPQEAELADRPKPKQEDFTDYNEFVETLSDWKAEIKAVETTTRLLGQDRQQNEARARENAHQRIEGQRRELWGQTSEAARNEHVDFDEVMEEADLPAFSDQVSDAILMTGIGGEVSYQLAKTTEGQRILNLPSDTLKIVEIGKLAASLQKPNGRPAPVVRKPNISNAPEPIKPMGGTGSKTVKDYAYYSSDQCSPAEYEEARRSGKLR